MNETAILVEEYRNTLGNHQHVLLIVRRKRFRFGQQETNLTTWNNFLPALVHGLIVLVH